ncbi:alpha/beta-hydrolase [Coprinellus micaceus]|uniref:Alpha/beta-hydrolase n=1 Tax=Coprinellus micaceus TaxID=71717 RepID=A0A4Y7SAM7_COPMI|nr:alpha/beta-hydrolase [Coprinellus micaceus]
MQKADDRREPAKNLLVEFDVLVTVCQHLGQMQGGRLENRRCGSPIVDLGYAQYQGVANSETGNTEFLGLRYAAPPTGTKCPLALPEAVDGLQMADTQPNRCQQAPERGTPGRLMMRPVSEDCLFLNVVIPGLDFSSTTTKKLPVVVWIHGGGYALGSISKPGLSSMRIYDGNDLVNDSGGKVISVLIQYRLGLFGFLAGEDVKNNGVLNAGLRDQQFALEWIQRHISKFGGDPEQVTIWGQSRHLIANGGKTNPPLFRAAMLSSAFLPSQYPYNASVPENAHDRLECLRDTDLADLREVNAKVAEQALYGTFAFVPVVDGDFIRESPIQALRRGRLNSEHVLAVVNTYEGRMFVDPETRGSVDVRDYLPKLFPMFRGNQIHLALTLYENLGDPFEQVIQIMEMNLSAIFVCPTYYILKSLKGKGFKAVFAIPPGDHIDDILYFFPSITPAGVPPFNNTALFMDFVRNGDPNVKSAGSILPHWPKWNRWHRKEVVFNRTGDVPDIRTAMTEQALLERCEFWESTKKWTGQ